MSENRLYDSYALKIELVRAHICRLSGRALRYGASLVAILIALPAVAHCQVFIASRPTPDVTLGLLVVRAHVSRDSTQPTVEVVLGGSRHFLGPVARAFAFLVLEDFSLRLTEHRDLVRGLLLVAVVFAFPGGLAGTASRLASRWSRLARA